MGALAKNDVRSLVADVLKEFMHTRLFAQLVHDVTTSIMLSFVHRMSRTEHNSCVVLIKQSMFDKANTIFDNDGRYKHLSSYWCGEDVGINEEQP